MLASKEAENSAYLFDQAINNLIRLDTVQAKDNRSFTPIFQQRYKTSQKMAQADVKHQSEIATRMGMQTRQHASDFTSLNHLLTGYHGG